MKSENAALNFLNDAKMELRAAFKLIGDDEINRVTLRHLIESLEKSIKATWIEMYSRILSQLIELAIKDKESCRERNEVKYVRGLEDPKKVGHAASLKVLKALVYIYYLLFCDSTCKLQPKILVKYIFNELLKSLEKLATKLAKGPKVKKIRKRIENYAKAYIQTSKERFENIIIQIMEKIDCNSLEKLKEEFNSGRKNSKPTKTCMEIREEDVKNTVNETLELLKKVKEDINTLETNIRNIKDDVIKNVIQTIRKDPILRREILEAPRMKNLIHRIDRIANILIDEFIKLVKRFYGVYEVLLLAKLHIMLYPCYEPSRYSHAGRISEEILNGNVMRELYHAVYELVDFMESLLFK